MSKLKIYSDKRYLFDESQTVTMLLPFWGMRKEDTGDPSSGRYDRYMAVGKNLFEMCPLEESDVAVLPSHWEAIKDDPEKRKVALDFIDLARAIGKKTIIFFWSDSDEPVPLRDTIIFRTSFNRSMRKANELAQPAWSEDMITKYYRGTLPIREKREKPVIGFCGFATPVNRKAALWNAMASMKRLKRPNLKALVETGASLRYKVINKITQADEVTTNFIIRNQFFSDATDASGAFDPGLAMRLRLEYVDNIINTDYTVCMRGAGNFSYRLYETLSCGRIPVFIDTDCVLPYDFDINWTDYCVFVDRSEIGRIGKKIREFHDRLSADEFVDMQRRCRSFWESKLSPEGFFAHLPEQLDYLEKQDATHR